MIAGRGHAVEVEDELVRRQVQLTVGAPVQYVTWWYIVAANAPQNKMFYSKRLRFYNNYVANVPAYQGLCQCTENSVREFFY